MAGPVTEVRAAVRGGVTTASTVHRHGAVGQVALSITTPDGPGGVNLDVVTDRGFVTMPSEPGDEAAVWRAITDEFAATVRSGEPHPLDVHHALRLQRVLDAVSRSVATGQPVVPLTGTSSAWPWTGVGQVATVSACGSASSTSGRTPCTC